MIMSTAANRAAWLRRQTTADLHHILGSMRAGALARELGLAAQVEQEAADIRAELRRRQVIREGAAAVDPKTAETQVLKPVPKPVIGDPLNRHGWIDAVVSALILAVVIVVTCVLPHLVPV